MISRTHRVTGGTSPGKKRRLTPCLIPHTEYLVHFSYTTTHNLFNQVCYFLLLETRGFEHVGYITMNSNYSQDPHIKVDEIYFCKLFSRDFSIFLYLLAFRFVLKSRLVLNPTFNSRTKIVDSLWVTIMSRRFSAPVSTDEFI